jgi:hypothetical protein
MHNTLASGHDRKKPVSPRYLLTGAGTFFCFWTKSTRETAGSQDLSLKAVATTFLFGSASQDCKNV